MIKELPTLVPSLGQFFISSSLIIFANPKSDIFMTPSICLMFTTFADQDVLGFDIPMKNTLLI